MNIHQQSDDFLTQEQEALLEQLLAQASIDSPELKQIEETLYVAPQDRFEPFVLTDIQQGYWLGRGAGFELGAVACYGYVEIDCPELDVDRLEKAFQDVIAHHDMLRVIFLSNGTQQVQQAVPYYDLKRIDLRGKDQKSCEHALMSLREIMVQQILPTDCWPLFDVRVSLLPDGAARIHFGVDALIADQSSLYIIVRDMVSRYQNPLLPLSDVEVSFRDYVISVDKKYETPVYAKARQYWMERIDQLAPAPQLPLAKPLTAVTTPIFVRVEDSLPVEQWEQFKSLASQNGVTPTNALMAAFSLVLMRWCRQQRFTLNMTMFDRWPVHSHINEVVGDFTAVTLLEADCSGRPIFAELARRLQRQLAEDMEHSMFSGVEILRELGRRRHTQGKAMMPIVFTSMVGLSKVVGMDTDIPSDFGSRGFTLSQTPQVLLDHHSFERAGRLDFNWDYISEAFPEGLIEGMFDAYASLVKLLANDPESWKTVLSVMLPQAQLERRYQYLNLAQQSAPVLSASVTLPGLFIESALQYPNKPAIAGDGFEWSYMQISCLAEHFAQRLQAHNIGHGDSVLIVMNKGWQQSVAALAVMALGGIYVPIDPQTPMERLQAIQQSLQTKVAAVQADTHIALEGVRQLEVDASVSNEPKHLTVRTNVTGKDLAYVIFTSGSTGMPKGVVIDHQGAVNTLLDVNARFGVTDLDKVFALSAFSFDLSVYDVFGIWAAGGTIVLPAPGTEREPASWVKLMHQYQVTLWNTVPALFQMLTAYLDHHKSEVPSALKMAWLSGDWIPLDLPIASQVHWPDLKFISMGGATEGSIWSIYYPVVSIESGWTSIPYGMPLGGQGIHVLTPDLEPVPEWTPGDLYISGIGVAQGYWKDKEKTAAQFIIHPQTGERLYRTGDLGRFNPRGYVEFLGREDQQIKINGFRVELGEIEAALLKSLDVAQAAALKTGDGSGILTAFVKPNEHAMPALFEADAILPEIKQKIEDAIVESGSNAQNALDPFFNAKWAQSYFDQLGALSLAMMDRSLLKLGILKDMNSPQSLKTMMHDAGIQERYCKLIQQWLGFLIAAGHIRYDQHGYTRILPVIDEKELQQRLQSVYACIHNHAALKQIIDYQMQCYQQHAALFQGNADPLSIIFPANDWKVIDSLYDHQPASSYLNHIAASICGVLGETMGRDDLSVLELDISNGATTTVVLPVLQPYLKRYIGTDRSSLFLTHCEKRLINKELFVTRVLDIDKNLQSQGISCKSQNIVIASALHDTVNLDQSLQMLYGILKPGGYLILIEGLQSHPSLAVSLGFLEGMLRFEDERIISHSPFLNASGWSHSLKTAGFEHIRFFPEEGHEARAFGQAVIVARRSGHLGPLNEELAKALVAHHVPSYMVPASIQEVTTLPLTANGKVDRKALAQSIVTPSHALREFVAPRNEFEMILADIWSQGLGIDKVSVIESLFELGGDSLFAVQLNNQITENFEVNLPLVDILQSPTIEKIAARIEQLIQKELVLQLDS